MAEVLLPYGMTERVVRIPDANVLAVASPLPAAVVPDPAAEIRRALSAPVAAPVLHEAVAGAKQVVIAVDDMTRPTPAQVIFPILLDELNAGGIKDEQVTVLIALGTHRPMTGPEIQAHFGQEVRRRVKIINNPWQDPAEIVSLGVTPNGTPVSISRIALETDFLIGVGSITPHHIPGFSGGSKIIQPGISGADTTGATHYFSTRTRRSYLGMVENPVRAEMDQIAGRVGLKAILNVVLDSAGRLVQAFYGDYIQAHRAGVDVSRQVYGVALPAQADIVIAGSHPCDIEFWQAHKSLYPADMAVKEGGTIIVVTPCPEGVTVMHQSMLEFTAEDAYCIQKRITDGEIPDLVSGALALAWAKVRQRATVCLVSEGITPEETRALGFVPYVTTDAALAAAFQRHGKKATVTVLTHAPDMLPILH